MIKSATSSTSWTEKFFPFWVLKLDLTLDCDARNFCKNSSTVSMLKPLCPSKSNFIYFHCRSTRSWRKLFDRRVEMLYSSWFDRKGRKILFTSGDKISWWFRPLRKNVFASRGNLFHHLEQKMVRQSINWVMLLLKITVACNNLSLALLKIK